VPATYFSEEKSHAQGIRTESFLQKCFPAEETPSSHQIFHTVSQAPEHPLFAFLGGYIPLHGAIQGWLEEMVKGRRNEIAEVKEQLWSNLASAGMSGQRALFLLV